MQFSNGKITVTIYQHDDGFMIQVNGATLDLTGAKDNMLEYRTVKVTRVLSAADRGMDIPYDSLEEYLQSLNSLQENGAKLVPIPTKLFQIDDQNRGTVFAQDHAIIYP
ncbi:hypothetical protein [Thermosynechococcus sp. FA-CM-4201]